MRRVATLALAVLAAAIVGWMHEDVARALQRASTTLCG